MPDLLGCHLFGIEEYRQCLVLAVPCPVPPRYLQGVTDTPLHWQAGGVEARPEVDRDLDVAEFAGGGDPVDGDVGRSERRPQVVGVLSEPHRGRIGGLEEGSGRTGIVCSGGGDRSAEQQRPVDGQQLRSSVSEVLVQVVSGVGR
jgi:hypothetical protein